MSDDDKSLIRKMINDFCSEHGICVACRIDWARPSQKRCDACAAKNVANSTKSRAKRRQNTGHATSSVGGGPWPF